MLHYLENKKLTFLSAPNCPNQHLNTRYVFWNFFFDYFSAIFKFVKHLFVQDMRTGSIFATWLIELIRIGQEEIAGMIHKIWKVYICLNFWKGLATQKLEILNPYIKKEKQIVDQISLLFYQYHCVPLVMTIVIAQPFYTRIQCFCDTVILCSTFFTKYQHYTRYDIQIDLLNWVEDRRL